MNIPSWHNLKITRCLPNGDMVMFTDFEMSLRDAVDTGVHENLGVVDIHKVEWNGPSAGIHFQDVTQKYKNLYHAMTHDMPIEVKRH